MKSSRIQKVRIWLQKDWLVTLTHVSAVILTLRLIWFLASGSFFIDPIRQTTTLTGRLAIAYLISSLACTPVKTVFGWSMVMRVRKPLGLYAFGFALLHGLTYVGWDYRFDLPLLLDNLQYQRYILIGGSSFLILAILAVTSIRALQKRMGKSWKIVQRLVYLAGGLAVLHVLRLRKSPREVLPLVFLLIAFFIIRVPWLKGVIIKLRQSLTKGM